MVKGMTSCRPPEKSNESEIKSNESEIDLINRQAAIDTAEAMHDRCDTLSVDDYRDMMVEALTVLPSADLQPTCKIASNDCISREAAIDAAIEAVDEWDDGCNLTRADMIADAINNTVPSAQPEITEDDVKEYCRKRCLIVVTSGFYDEMTRRWATAQPYIIRCMDCKHSEHWYRDKARCFLWHEEGIDVFEDGYCSYAERRTDE